MTESISTARTELAPTGTLRVALNMSNFLLTATDPVSGAPCGIAADLGRELGLRLGVPVALLPYPNPGVLADAAPTGVWDVGFLGAEPQRAQSIDFTAAYVEIEATYLVPPGSLLQTIVEVDRPGIRIVAPERSAYELYLSRTLKHAQLVRERGADNAFKRLVVEHLDALAGLRPRLVTDQEALPGSRLLEGNFTAVQQAAGTPTGCPAGARYLRDFIEDIKATGLVAQTIARHNVRGLTVAPLA
jgi:polar amino acid transport system substrate-binding protein